MYFIWYYVYRGTFYATTIVYWTTELCSLAVRHFARRRKWSINRFWCAICGGSRQWRRFRCRFAPWSQAQIYTHGCLWLMNVWAPTQTTVQMFEAHEQCGAGALDRESLHNAVCKHTDRLRAQNLRECRRRRCRLVDLVAPTLFRRKRLTTRPLYSWDLVFLCLCGCVRSSITRRYELWVCVFFER